MKIYCGRKPLLLQKKGLISKKIFIAWIILSFAFSGVPSHAACPVSGFPDESICKTPCFPCTSMKNDHSPFAFDLCSIYEMARCHDPTILAAKQAQLAAQEALPQAAASFLPVLAAQATHQNAYDNGASFFSPPTTPGGIETENPKVGSYVSNVFTVTLEQPILHFEHWRKYEQACDQVKQANATFAAAEQDLMIRVSNAYFGVLQGVDQVYYATAQLTALKKFYDQTNERFKVGLIAITDVQIAKARHDSSVALVIAAKTELSNQLQKLRELVGYYVEHLLPLKDNICLPPPEPRDPEQWVVVALQQNFALKAQRYKTLVARDDIKITEMGHLPTLDLLGQSQRITPSNQVQLKGTTSQLTLQVNFPIFSGGSVISKTRQARHLFLQSDKETEALFRSVESNSRQFFLNVLTQISEAAAYKQAIASNQSALEATLASFNVGTRTIVDVLNAQTDLIQAQLNYATARYAYILQSFELKRAAGTLSPIDLCALNCWMKSTPADATLKTGEMSPSETLNYYKLPNTSRVSNEEQNKIMKNINTDPTNNTPPNPSAPNSPSSSLETQTTTITPPSMTTPPSATTPPSETTPTSAATPPLPTTPSSATTPATTPTNNSPVPNLPETNAAQPNQNNPSKPLLDPPANQPSDPQTSTTPSNTSTNNVPDPEPEPPKVLQSIPASPFGAEPPIKNIENPSEQDPTQKLTPQSKLDTLMNRVRYRVTSMAMDGTSNVDPAVKEDTTREQISEQPQHSEQPPRSELQEEITEHVSHMTEQELMNLVRYRVTSIAME